MQAVVSRACATTTTEIRRPPCIKGLSDREGGHAQQLVLSSLAASVQNELTNLFVVVVVVKVIVLIIKHPLRYLLLCCVEAGGGRVSNS
jgi:hypothetical protein